MAVESGFLRDLTGRAPMIRALLNTLFPRHMNAARRWGQVR